MTDRASSVEDRTWWLPAPERDLLPGFAYYHLDSLKAMPRWAWGYWETRSANWSPVVESVGFEHWSSAVDLVAARCVTPLDQWVCPNGKCDHPAIGHEISWPDDDHPRPCLTEGCDCA